MSCGKIVPCRDQSHSQMCAVMDWWLIYRAEVDMQSLLDQISTAELGKVRLYRDPDEQILFLEVVRA